MLDSFNNMLNNLRGLFMYDDIYIIPFGLIGNKVSIEIGPTNKCFNNILQYIKFNNNKSVRYSSPIDAYFSMYCSYDKKCNSYILMGNINVNDYDAIEDACNPVISISYKPEYYDKIIVTIYEVWYLADFLADFSDFASILNYNPYAFDLAHRLHVKDRFGIKTEMCKIVK